MSTARIWRTVSTSSDETLNLGAAMGRKLSGGEVIELVSDLGGGKTTFVRGLAKGIGSRDHVHSPSFTLANEYKGQKIKIFHIDLYRLNLLGILREELNEFLNEPEAILVIEWPGLIKNLLPADAVSVKIKVTGETEREFSFEFPDSAARLFPIT